MSRHAAFLFIPLLLSSTLPGYSATGDLVQVYRVPSLADVHVRPQFDFGRGLVGLESTVAVSAPSAGIGPEDDPVTGVGAVFIYDAVTGELRHTVTGPSRMADTSFGFNVARHGDLLVTGAHWDYSNGNFGDFQGGRVFLVDLDEGQVVRTIVSEEPSTYQQLGFDVAAAGTQFAATALFESEPFDGGRIVVYDDDGTTRTYADPNRGPDSFVGLSVAMAEGRLLMSALGPAATVGDVNRVLIWNTFSGELLATLSEPEPNAGLLYAQALEVVGDAYVVGAPGGANGRIYVYDSTTHELLRTIRNPDPLDPGAFGYSLAAIGDDVLAGGRNKAFLFDGDTGELLHTFLPPEPSATTFGVEVASWGSWALVASDTAVYAFEVVPEPSAMTLTLIGGLSLLWGSRFRR